jgi:prepilin-type processing-associated H-X9-DG protein
MIQVFTREQNYFGKGDRHMKRAGAAIGAVVATFAAGAALILGNAAFAAQMSGAVAQEKASDVKPMAAAQSSADASAQSVAEENGEDRFVVMKTLPNGSTVLVEYYYDEDGAKATVAYADGSVEAYEGEAAEASIERFGGPKRDRHSRYAEGQPGEGDIAKEDAVSTAIKAVTDKYALTEETLGRFSVTAKFYSVYEDMPGALWNVSLYPSNVGEFSEIGCYTALIGASTGETLKTLSAADGKG